MKKLVCLVLLGVLAGCSSVHVTYTRDGITETMEVDAQGHHVITFTPREVTISSD